MSPPRSRRAPSPASPGVSGGGKSTFTIETLYKAAARRLHNASDAPAPYERIEGLELFDKVIDIDQSPIGRTPRSNPATYTGAFQPIRDWFAGLPESKARGYGPGRFSFNVKGGRCEACQGDGLIKIEMHFLPDVYVTCDVCHGHRYNRETLEILFKGKSISDVLDMTVDEAAEFFKAVPVLREKMQTLNRVGLGYVKVGQSSTTLSGGEAQRVKLSKELSRRATGKTLYILDEPTTGLHFEDTKKLLEVLHELVEQGNTVVVIEHNLDVVKTADWVVDFGPEGGDGGGEIVATGTPEQVAASPNSWTGRYLAELLERHEAPPSAPSGRRAGRPSRRRRVLGEGQRLWPGAILTLANAMARRGSDGLSANRADVARRRPVAPGCGPRSRSAGGRYRTAPAASDGMKASRAANLRP